MRIIICFGLICFGFSIHAQSDSSILKKYKLKEYKVHSYMAPSFEPASQKMDSVLLMQNKYRTVKDLLQWYSNVFVRNYGINNLSTLSIRGSSAAQSQVLWHGLNINNAATGLTDLSLLPIALFGNVKINYQEGKILLDNDSTQSGDANFSGGITLESIQNLNVGLKKTLAYHKIKFSINAYGQWSKNRFSFVNSFLEKQDTLVHAKNLTGGLLTDFQYKLNKNKHLSYHSWIHGSNREIPPTLYELSSMKNEKLVSFRNILSYNQQINSSIIKSLQMNVGIFLENYQFSDSSIGLVNHVPTTSIPCKLNLGLSKGFKIQVLSNYQGISKPTSHQLLSGGFRLEFQHHYYRRKIFISTFTQNEKSNVFKLPFIYGVLLKYKIRTGIEIYANAYKHYRQPTLNELYYQPGGNLNLKPENGDNLDGGFIMDKSGKKFQLYSDLGFFKRRINNWITWYGNTILTPHNIHTVSSRGLEYQSRFRYRMNTFYHAHNEQPQLKYTDLYGSILYSYTLATTEKSLLYNDYSVGKQLPFLPRYQFKLRLGAQLLHWDFSYDRSYVGYRFTTTDESEFLLPYRVHNLHVHYINQLKNLKLIYHVDFLNVLNENYMSLPGRIMPGRQVNLGVQFHY